MIQSMTGYGKTVLQLPERKITVEIKSLNSKNLDINVRIPAYYREKELEIRKQIALETTRGKIDFSIYIEENGSKTNSKINKNIVSEYINQLKNIATGRDIDFLEMAIRLPDALKTEKEELNEQEWQHIQKAIEKTLKELVAYRKDEGKALLTDFEKRIKNIQALLKKVSETDPERVIKIKEKLKKSISEIKEKADENRFEQELIYYIEKIDITEEKVRLKNHLEYFMLELKSIKSNGKKLGFISQEIGREINTIGSKANYAPMQKLVVQMKDELEKIKEQSLNVL